MNLHELLLYQVVEFDSGILIMAQHDKLNRPGVVPLIIADGATVPEYLARYIHARERGMDLKTAHAKALEGAHIPMVPGKPS